MYKRNNTIDWTKVRVFVFTAVITCVGITMGCMAEFIVRAFLRIPAPDFLEWLGGSSLVFSSVSVVWVVLLNYRQMKRGLINFGIFIITAFLILGTSMSVGTFYASSEYSLDAVSVARIICGVISVLTASFFSGAVEGGRE